MLPQKAIRKLLEVMDRCSLSCGDALMGDTCVKLIKIYTKYVYVTSTTKKLLKNKSSGTHVTSFSLMLTTYISIVQFSKPGN